MVFHIFVRVNGNYLDQCEVTKFQFSVSQMMWGGFLIMDWGERNIYEYANEL